MTRYYVLLAFVAVIDVRAKLLCSLMYDEALHLLPSSVETEVAIAVSHFEDFVLDGVGNTQPVVAVRLD